MLVHAFSSTLPVGQGHRADSRQRPVAEVMNITSRLKHRRRGASPPLPQPVWKPCVAMPVSQVEARTADLQETLKEQEMCQATEILGFVTTTQSNLTFWKKIHHWGFIHPSIFKEVERSGKMRKWKGMHLWHLNAHSVCPVLLSLLSVELIRLLPVSSGSVEFILLCILRVHSMCWINGG